MKQSEAGVVWLALAIVFALFLIAGATVPVQAQTYSVIHNFTGGQDGAYPFAGLTIDAAGNLYGTAFAGGSGHYGTVFELTVSGSSWTFGTLYSFMGGRDGEGPVARPVFGHDGSLYGSTSAGGEGPCNSHNGYLGCGTIYKLSPPGRSPGVIRRTWTSSVLYRFAGSNGSYPQGDLIFDSDGEIFGTAINGGSSGFGLVYSLTSSGGGWNQSVLYEGSDGGGGEYPWGGLVADGAGNLYGTFSQGGSQRYGTMYKLTPSGSGWTPSTIHTFSFHGNDGAWPQGGLTVDRSGNLMGSTVHSVGGGGIVYKMTAGGDWTYDFVYNLTGGINLGPYDKLVMDSAGNLYGTTFADGRYGLGSVFKLTHSSGGWTYTSLHDFTGGSDGGNPISSLVFDSDGNLYGTASDGGAHGVGVVFQVTP